MGISDYLFDYSAHALTFGVLMFLSWRWVRASPFVILRRTEQASLRAAGLLAAGYAASDEFHQHFVPGRWPNLSDWLADVLGILAVAGLLAAWVRWGEHLVGKARMYWHR